MANPKLLLNLIRSRLGNKLPDEVPGSQGFNDVPLPPELDAGISPGPRTTFEPDVVPEGKLAAAARSEREAEANASISSRAADLQREISPEEDFDTMLRQIIQEELAKFGVK